MYIHRRAESGQTEGEGRAAPDHPQMKPTQPSHQMKRETRDENSGANLLISCEASSRVLYICGGSAPLLYESKQREKKGGATEQRRSPCAAAAGQAGRAPAPEILPLPT